MKTPAEGGQPPGEVPARGRRRKRRGKKRRAAGDIEAGAAPREDRQIAAQPTGSAAANGQSGRKGPEKGRHPDRGAGAEGNSGARMKRARRTGERTGADGRQDAGERSNSSGRADKSPNHPRKSSNKKNRKWPAQARGESVPDGNKSGENGEDARRSDGAWRANKRRRRRGGKKNGGQKTGQQNGHERANGGADTAAIRNLRSPISPVEPPSFDEAKARAAPKSGQAARQKPHRQGHRGGKPPWRGDRRKNDRGRNAHGLRPAFAALDLGTNNCRLLVAVPVGTDRFKVIDAFSRIVRLGEGMETNGRLGEAAMERALEALAVCAAKLRHHPIAGQRLIATEACRRAENGAQFLDEVKRRTGLELEVVDRETEARLAAEGCGTLMDRQAQGAVLFDIGGGSSELVLVDRKDEIARQVSRQIAGWTSLPLGVVTLSERHGGRRVTRGVFGDMVAEVLEHLAGFAGRDSLAHIWADGQTHLLGTSGTVTTIAGVHLKLPRYDRRKVDGIWLSDVEIDSVIDELLEMDYEARALNPCIGRDRADLVLAGCAILQAIRKTWPSKRLRVADRGLREGILSELMLEAGVWKHDGPAARGSR